MSCAPLYRTYQVAKGLVFIPPLAVIGVTTLVLNKTVVVLAPVDFIINGNLEVTIGQSIKRQAYLHELFYKTGLWIVQ
jgi:hypothetical protein